MSKMGKLPTRESESVKGALKTESRAGQRSETMGERNRKASLHSFSFAGTQM